MRLGECGAMRRGTEFALRHVLAGSRKARCAPPSSCRRPRSGRSRGHVMTTPSLVATWNPERVQQLRNFVVAGLTCSQIAAEIGVTRNAVIGKIHRLGLSPGRPAGVPARSCPPRARPPRLPSQRRVLRLAAKTPFVPDPTAAQIVLVDSAERCSLLELGQGKCRWPVSDPGAVDFAFCGNDAITGFPYCAGHVRMAYRSPARRRA